MATKAKAAAPVMLVCWEPFAHQVPEFYDERKSAELQQRRDAVRDLELQLSRSALKDQERLLTKLREAEQHVDEALLGANANAGEIIAVRRLERVRSDDWRITQVRGAIEHFAPEDTPDVELQAMYQRSISQGIAAGIAIADETQRAIELARPKPPPPLPPIPVEHAVVAIKRLGPIGASVASVAAVSRDKNGEPLVINKFEQADDRWQVVRRNRSAFVKVLPEGLAVEDAVVCCALEHVTIVGAGGRVARRLWRGQMTAKTDPLVEIHPSMFQPALAMSASSRDQQTFVIVAQPDQVMSDSGRPGRDGVVIFGREAAD